MYLATALGFYSMFGSQESVLGLEQMHEVVTVISKEAFPALLQTEQKYIGRWREAIEVEMNLKQSDAYQTSSGVRYVMGSIVTSLWKSRYPIPDCDSGREEHEDCSQSTLLRA